MALWLPVDDFMTRREQRLLCLFQSTHDRRMRHDDTIVPQERNDELATTPTVFAQVLLVLVPGLAHCKRVFPPWLLSDHSAHEREDA